MQKRTREIVALLLLGLLLVVAAGAMGYYILIGHNWNRAASTIDEQLGTMDDYTVIIYRGTLEPADLAGAKSKTPAAGSSQPEVAHEEALELMEVTRLYRGKNASVFALDLSQERWYKEPVVMQAGSKRIGVFSLGTRAFNVQSMMAVKQLKRQGVDYTVALTHDQNVCKQGIQGLDMIFCVGSDSVPVGGEYQGVSFCLGDAPSDDLRAIIVSPSGVHSTKAVE